MCPRNHQAALDDDGLDPGSLRAPLLLGQQQDLRPPSPKSGPSSPKGPVAGGSIAQVVGGGGVNGDGYSSSSSSSRG